MPNRNHRVRRGFENHTARLAARTVDRVVTDEQVADLKAALAPPLDEPTTVYYLHTADHQLLYVGITLSRNGLERLNSGHRHDKSWWTDVAYASMEHFPTRHEAQAREAYAIRALNPRHNVVKPTVGQARLTEYGVLTCAAGCGGAAPDSGRVCGRCKTRRYRERKAAS